VIRINRPDVVVTAVDAALLLPLVNDALESSTCPAKVFLALLLPSLSRCGK
jgi:hypothetical protein